MKCNICGGTQFAAQGTRKKVRCTGCNSLERTRMLWLALEQMIGRKEIGPKSRVLHIAPERGIYQKLGRIVAPENYHTADISPEHFTGFAPQTRRMDLCDLDACATSEYDLILHSHVLEHTPCNIAYTLYHLHRMLRPEGRHVFIVPFLGGRFDECFQNISDDERVRRFGQNDHVRRFGKEDIGAHLGALLSLPETPDAAAQFGDQTLVGANIPEPCWTGFTPATVISLRREDMKFI